MKTKLYTLLTGLLMAACLTSYGQEIVSDFTLRNGYLFSDTDIQECSDGTLLTGISFYTSNYDESGFLVCKTTPEGELIDSLKLDYGWNLYSINGMSDSFVIPSFRWDDADSTLSFRMTFIDADLHITNEILSPVFVGVDYDSNPWSLDEMFLDPQGNFVFSYWTDLVEAEYWAESAVFHLMRINLEGTLISESETDAILPPNWSNMHPTDSALAYWGGFGVYDEYPLLYYKLGGYIGTSASHPWPLFTYLFDEDLNLIDTLIYGNIAEGTYFDWTGDEHITFCEMSTFKENHLMAAQIHYPNNSYEMSLVKFDTDNNILAMTSVESPNTEYGSPIMTTVADENTIFLAYNTYPSNYNEVVGLARLDSDLNILWNIILPGTQYNFAYGHCLKVLQNGDVALAFSNYFYNSGDRLHLYIIHDGYDSTPETTISERPFTLYPNPVNDLLNLRFDDGEEPESVELYNLVGRLVASRGNNIESIDMSAMSSGVYMLCVTMKDGTRYHEKIVKD